MYIDDMYVVHIYNIIYFEVPQYIIYIMYHIYTLYIYMSAVGGLIDVPLCGVRINKNSVTTVPSNTWLERTYGISYKTRWIYDRAYGH